MELTQLIALLGGLSFALERTVEYVFDVFWHPGKGNGTRATLLRSLVLVVSLVVAVVMNLRLLQVVGFDTGQYLDNVFSGVMLAGGSELMHQAFQRVKK